MSRTARSRATSFFSAAISASSACSCPFPGKTAAGAAANSRIQRRSTLSAWSRHAWATETSCSVTSFTASILNSRLNFRLVSSTLHFHGHDLLFVSMEPAAGQPDVKP
jgi:hypothetical protein